MKLENNILYDVNGGSSLSASMVEGISRLFTTVFTIGKSVGSSIRRIYSKNLC